MSNYIFKIIAKKRNAIGIFSEFMASVEADNLKQAELKLYDNYDHIRIISVVENGQRIQYAP